MATVEKSCENCKKTGLPILPVRYTVLPTLGAPILPGGIHGKGVTDVEIKEHRYGLRTVREGWLYLFYVVGPRGSNYWEAYKITEDGRLWKQTLPLPLVPKTDPACAQKSIAVPMDIIAIEKPEKCTDRVYIAFSEYAWHKDTFKLYAQKEALRIQRMQWIEPSKWIASGQCKEGHATVATEQTIDAVIEYMPGFYPKVLQPVNDSKNDPMSKVTGEYDPTHVRREATRYPLHIRQATPASASVELVTLMNNVGEIGKNKHYPPMLLALWDSVGNVHELNGFRNDAASMLGVYVRERATQLDAMQSIEAADIAVRNGAVASKSWWRSALQAGFENMANQPGAGYGVMTFVSPEQQAASDKRIAEAGEISPQEAKKIGEEAWPKYLKKLDQPKYNNFKIWFKSLRTAVKQLQARRASDVEVWLKAPLFLATLHDYREDNLPDGIAFEAVIAEAITGLPSEETGAKVVEDLVNNMDATAAGSLVWRAFAYNQSEPKAEIKELLTAATSYKATVWEEASEVAEKVAKQLEKLKTFVEFREKMGEVKEHTFAISATEEALKKIQVDRFVISITEGLFKWTGYGKFADRVGARLIQGALLIRVGIPQADTIGLIKESAKADPALRLELENGYRALRSKGVKAAEAYAQTLESLAENDKGKAVRAKWNAVRLTGEGAEAATGIRIGSTLMIIELFCFGAALMKADKTREDYAMLVASGFSSASACLQPAAKAMAAMAKEAAGTLANLKAVTGVFSGIASGIGSVIDFSKSYDAGADDRYALMSAYFVKGFLGLLSAAANLLTALSSAAPLIARMTGGRGVAWLGNVRGAIVGAAERSEVLAKTALSVADREAAAGVAGRLAVGVGAEEVGAVVGERAALLLLGRCMLYLAGWEVAVVLTVIQLLIWYFSDNDLQTWLEKCAFGKSSKYPPGEAGKQHEEFEKALAAVGLQASEGSE
ncbi:T6SS effector BTH_I2691 family protein [Paraburkholderia megapolitana]|uniref:Toxin VasX N-terminal region domain-containing protein n=1 Tax=Paraburkholderia megapolitana TaxID=420953 RepID=A0A1I3URA4_9BURK|nr:T6SS effector BTH_I2691 family protein [Paraburkholderia megapolitana]QDQ82323.1 hypothetical protein FNZ07_13600 [Paraburkholderia megapolitana]SFJ85435.1 hypothetical protein SAMN05192543_11244 [Paraburkholderia megapolitana]